MRRPAYAGLTLALALAACSREPAMPPEVQDPGKDQAPAVTPGTVPLPSAIPAAFHGRWGIVRDDCTSSRGDAKGLLIIAERNMNFYEAVASLTKVLNAAQDTVLADFEFNGEGQTWTSQQRLTLREGGKTLERTENGAEMVANPTVYIRCKS